MPETLDQQIDRLLAAKVISSREEGMARIGIQRPETNKKTAGTSPPVETREQQAQRLIQAGRFKNMDEFNAYFGSPRGEAAAAKQKEKDKTERVTETPEQEYERLVRAKLFKTVEDAKNYLSGARGLAQGIAEQIQSQVEQGQLSRGQEWTRTIFAAWWGKRDYRPAREIVELENRVAAGVNQILAEADAAKTSAKQSGGDKSFHKTK